MAELDFDPESAPRDDRSFDVIPTAWYTAQIIESDVVPTKDGDGQRLTLTWEIIEGDFSKRRVWQSLNIVNKSAQAQEMAQRDLRTICEAVGHAGRLSNSKDLEFKPCQIRVGTQRDDRERNEVKSAKALNDNAPRQQSEPRQSQPRQEAQPQQRQAAGGRPWKR
jgi:hypothetical protein